jgi:zinc protease
MRSWRAPGRVNATRISQGGAARQGTGQPAASSEPNPPAWHAKMRPMKTHLPFRVLVLSAAVAAAASALAAPAAAALPAQLREVEGVHEYQMPNGLQVLLIPDASKPTVTVNMTYHVGSRMEGYGETGMAHLLEHLMFKSTKNIPNVGAELSKRGMGFNGSTNADRTNYHETFPSDPAQLAWALKTEAERMTHANVIKKDLDTEMTVVRNEMESGENSPFRILMEKTNAAAYQWHAYGKDTIGARSDVENVNIPHLQAFYRKYYQPDNATLIVAGSFDAAKVLAEITQDFSAIPKPTRVIEPSYTVEPVQDGEREVTLRRVGGEKDLFVTYHIPSMASPEMSAFEIIATALGDTPNGRLYKRLVATGKATQTFAWANQAADPGQFNAGAQLKKDDDLDAAQKIFLDTVEGLKAEPITAEELKRTQLQLDKQFDQMLADPEQLCLALSESIAGGDWRLLFLERDRVDSATLEQVNAAATEWITRSNRTLGRFIPTDAPDRTPLATRSDPEVALKDFKPRASVAAGEAFDSTPLNLDKRTQLITLPDGLKLALLPKKTKGETVEVALNLHFGALDNLRGLAVPGSFVAATLPTGTTTKTRAQLADAFDALKTDWSVSGTPEGASASLTTKRDTLVPALELLAEVLRKPAFDAAEFEQIRRQTVQGYEKAMEDPGTNASVTLQQALQHWPADDPRYVASLTESADKAKAVKLDDVSAFYRSHWGADHADLAIVGDFDPVQVKAAVTRLLGDWKSPVVYQRLDNPPSDVVGQRLVTPLKDKANAVVIGQLPLKLQDTDADYPALLLATHVLGGGGFDSKEGISYGVGSGLRASAFEPSGTLQFFAIYAPENRGRLETGFSEEIARFVKDGITADELVTAKKAMLAERTASRTNDGAVAGGWAARLEQGRTFAFSADQDAKLEALTLEQVNAAIRKWIVPGNVDWSTAGSFPAAK